MEWLNAEYSNVKNCLLAALPEEWVGLYQIAADWYNEPFTPEIALPLAACQAVGGSAAQASSVAASLLASAISMRILDDVQDQDNPNALWALIGNGRAFNFAFVFQTVAFKILQEAELEPEAAKRVRKAIIDGFLFTAAGQDRDLAQLTDTIEDYYLTIELKTATPYATAVAVGAAVHTNNEAQLQACRDFGHHLGMAAQILNDYNGIWGDEGAKDLQDGKITLPLLYGLQTENAYRNTLTNFVQRREIHVFSDKIRYLLELIETPAFLWNEAIKHRQMALDAIATLPDEQGKAALEACFTHMFVDIDRVLAITTTKTEEEILAIEPTIPTNSSEALSLRRNIVAKM